jgi:creatinine amidohydrolase/Fe(II)-dependent formamide hydrolase-like protein
MRDLLHRVTPLVIAASICVARPAAAQILRLTDLNAPQLRALDRSKTVVLLTGGMLEEHGPYLPAYTDGILSDRLTQEVARSVIAKKPGWTVLLFPQIPFGSAGSNEIGGQFTAPPFTSARSTMPAISSATPTAAA